MLLLSPTRSDLVRGQDVRCPGIVPADIGLTKSRGVDDKIPLQMKVLRTLVNTSIGLGIVTGMVGCSSANYSSKPTKAVDEVMQAGFKGKDPALKGSDSVAGRIREGNATPDDIRLMVELTRQLALNSPPKGELASWTAKTVALRDATKNLADHKPGALEIWKDAANCKACHSLHKPDKAK